MPDGDIGMLGAIAVRTAIVLLALVAGTRLLGHRPLGEMNVRDLLLVTCVCEPASIMLAALICTPQCQESPATSIFSSSTA